MSEEEQTAYLIPDVSIKELLDAIPQHCYKRSAIKSSIYTVYHLGVIGALYKGAALLDSLISPAVFQAHPLVYPAARFALWSVYGFWAGLFGTGIWVIGHEAGHQAFSESKFINNTVGWILHSALGVPYHSWRITHAKHHASTSHLTQDQVWVPKTRSQVGLAPLDPKREDRLGARASLEVQKELVEALGDSPIMAAWGVAMYLILGWPMYILRNASGQRRYPRWITNHFNPKAVMFAPHQFGSVVWSDIGVGLWLAGLFAASSTWGFSTVFRVYLVPYLWVNHWLVLITFLQHTDPLLPHYRAAEFNFQRGALSTLDRSLLGDLGRVMGWIGRARNIPHYNAWEASAALREKVLKPAGIRWEGAPGGWAEMMRVFRECRFVEDEGDVVFFKNARGLAAARPVFNDLGASDSGIDVSDKKN
ncbi:Oleoyl phosphatidylcholine desaturase [Mycena kentingensis (nom. inval.)]|nr:Oleoyl phosphatidylcholine desaturase [Mycena kentingensis (nom. inval.)]